MEGQKRLNIFLLTLLLMYRNMLSRSLFVRTQMQVFLLLATPYYLLKFHDQSSSDTESIPPSYQYPNWKWDRKSCQGLVSSRHLHICFHRLRQFSYLQARIIARASILVCCFSFQWWRLTKIQNWGWKIYFLHLAQPYSYGWCYQQKRRNWSLKLSMTGGVPRSHQGYFVLPKADAEEWAKKWVKFRTLFNNILLLWMIYHKFRTNILIQKFYVCKNMFFFT